MKKPIYKITTAVDDRLIKNINKDYLLNKNRDYNDLYILFLSRIELYKGIVETVEAYQILKKKYPVLKLIVAGDGSFENQTKEYIEKNNISDIIFTGYIKGIEKEKIFKKSYIYVFPTYGEGLPISVLEAMAFGLPIVTRPVGGIKDFFISGKMGYMSSSLEPIILAQMIEKILINRNLRVKISIFNYEYAQKYFLASDVAKKMEKIYRNT